MSCHFPDGVASNSGAGNSAGSVSSVSGNGGTDSGPGSSGGSSRLGVREMMQRAVTAARSASSSLAGLDVEEDAPIPTLHWPPEAPGDNTVWYHSVSSIHVILTAI